VSETPTDPTSPPAFPGRDRLIATHRDLLERWRDLLNLVGPGPIDWHYRDAEIAFRGVDVRGRWADLGTGAGFPGIVVAAQHPAAAIELVDARRKRCTFLEEVVERAGAAGVTVRCARIEDLPAGAYDGVTARALAPPPDVCAFALRLLRPGGHAVLLIGDRATLDLPDGLTLISDRAYDVDGRAHRAVVLRRAP
jgi:16S rRNA (guanine(527)-N(7))-methyltransferase RsmG